MAAWESWQLGGELLFVQATVLLFSIATRAGNPKYQIPSPLIPHRTGEISACLVQLQCYRLTSTCCFGVHNETSRLPSSATKVLFLITTKPSDTLPPAEASAEDLQPSGFQHRLVLSISYFPTDGASYVEGQNREKLVLLRDTCLDISSEPKGKSICFETVCMCPVNSLYTCWIHMP